MKKKEALKFVKKIIEKGKEKGQNTKTIKINVETYIDILVSDNLIDADAEKTLRYVTKNIKDIVTGGRSVDQVVEEQKVLIKKATAKTSKKKEKTHEVYVVTISETSCGGSRSC